MDNLLHALSIDLEEWYHPALVKGSIKTPKESQIWDSSNELLTLLNDYDIKATFFIVGEIAQEHPQLIHTIFHAGHEVAFHGFSHTPLYKLTPVSFQDELVKAKNLFGSILGSAAIKGFRAPNFSLTQKTAWAVDILKSCGFTYDSSVFPVTFPYFYECAGAPLSAYGINASDITIADATSTLKEFPVTVSQFGRIRLPITGGTYLRIYPFWLQKRILTHISRHRPLLLYIHPWECFEHTPRIRINPIGRFLSYHNIHSTVARLKILFRAFRFTRIDTVLGV
ncbi:MAG: polysaccharide deacetylase family protein [Candidatus Omnitrophica bacterium]|nr:polysaccharide deacetylase family protein [Candidatus Omnitrophota bacterium]